MLIFVLYCLVVVTSEHMSWLQTHQITNNQKVYITASNGFHISIQWETLTFVYNWLQGANRAPPCEWYENIMMALPLTGKGEGGLS